VAVIFIGENRRTHIGDKFLNLIEPFAAETPYMTCPGNHEQK
jgi:hypothetical protein